MASSARVVGTIEPDRVTVMQSTWDAIAATVDRQEREIKALRISRDGLASAGQALADENARLAALVKALTLKLAAYHEGTNEETQ